MVNGKAFAGKLANLKVGAIYLLYLEASQKKQKIVTEVNRSFLLRWL